MTRFLLSHNLQVVSENLKGLNSADLAAGLVAHLPTDVHVQALSHPHWLVQVEADLLPIDLANAVLQAWRQLRCSAGAADDACQLLALGGRKDDQAASGALLQRSDWGGRCGGDSERCRFPSVDQLGTAQAGACS